MENVKTYRFIDKSFPETHQEKPMSLWLLFKATDWSEKEFDKITNLEVGQKLEFDDGVLSVERIS